MNAKRLLALWGLKWNPFSPELPSEGMLVTAAVENFAWRVEQLVQEGGFALVCGESGTGKSVALRIVAERLAALRDVVLGVLQRPQSRPADFYRELGDVFSVKLTPWNRWGGFKALRERWRAHLTSSRIKPVLLVDEAQEMSVEVLSELRLLSSADFDAKSLLTVVLAGDGRLLERLRHPDLVPLASRIRTRLWGASSVGVIGGAPKCSKTWLGLDLALSVATGTACLGRYAVPQPGPVLIYLAEDSLPIVRQRVEGMARHRGLALERVEIHVITAPTLRLDRDPHRRQLQETAQRLRPRLLLLDPLVRLHGIDENSAGEVASLLAYIRALQRELDLSVMLVHHTRKNAAGAAAGQSLRGSGDGHAFGDSNLYLRRVKDRLLLVSEHRAAPASPPVYLELVATAAETIHLEVVTGVYDQPQRSLPEQILALLAGGVVLTRAKLRDTLAVKNERLGEALESLERAGRLRRTQGGWQRLD
jgi:type II secretory pathway predicted ATPase ExeA